MRIPGFRSNITQGYPHMSTIILASGSSVRAQLLRQARIDIEVKPARVDEESVKAALLAEGATPRDVSDALAELKARKISEKNPGSLVLGCDQVLYLDGRLLSKPRHAADAIEQLLAMSGKRHTLFSAAVICEDGRPIWRQVGEVRMHVRSLSRGFIEEYVARNWESIRETVGCYKLEEEGVRLFSRIEGDYFSVLGLPLLEIVSYLSLRRDLST